MECEHRVIITLNLAASGAKRGLSLKISSPSTSDAGKMLSIYNSHGSLEEGENTGSEEKLVLKSWQNLQEVETTTSDTLSSILGEVD